jgi:glycosyltransferase involved in cell wall biosynthesis
MPLDYVSGMISILCPTRGRPENVIRKVNSILSTSHRLDLVEIIFYVDNDDVTFPEIILNNGNVTVVKGPRMWLSILQNVLYSYSKGEIIMYTGDDVVFETNGWDEIIREEFNAQEDKILLVYGTDGGYYGDRIALHGFLHRDWVNTVGCWVQPGRAVPYDYWLTDTARKLGRLKYIDSLRFAHIHYRQGDASAKFDSTYYAVSNLQKSFRPLITYKNMERERRIDRILLSEKMLVKPKTELKYLLGELFAELRFLKLDVVEKRRLKTFNNIRFILYFRKLTAKFFQSRK